MESLLSRIEPERLAKLLGDPLVFEQTLRQTRNYFTHPGIPKKNEVLTNSKAIFLFNQKLHVLLRLLLLKSVGFPEDAIFDPMSQQLHRWS